MTIISLMDITGSELEAQTNLPVLIAKDVPLSDDDTDARTIKADVFGSLGITARPWHSTDEGSAQALLAGGHVIGLRDTRCGAIYGELSPGDTCLHSTDDTESVRLLMKGSNRQAALVVTTEDGKDQVLNLGSDGLTISAGGCVITLKDGVVSILSAAGSGIIADAQGVWVKGSSIKLGANPNQTLPPVLLTPPLVGNLGAPISPLPLPQWVAPMSIFFTIP